MHNANLSCIVTCELNMLACRHCMLHHASVCTLLYLRRQLYKSAFIPHFTTLTAWQMRSWCRMFTPCSIDVPGSPWNVLSLLSYLYAQHFCGFHLCQLLPSPSQNYNGHLIQEPRSLYFCNFAFYKLWVDKIIELCLWWSNCIYFRIGKKWVELLQMHFEVRLRFQVSAARQREVLTSYQGIGPLTGDHEFKMKVRHTPSSISYQLDTGLVLASIGPVLSRH